MPIRVLVAEDSLTVRRHLVEVLGSDPEMEVIGEAADGADAMRLCEHLRPDVVTMDMMMPNVTGPEATEYIMAHCPTPILIVSASTNRGEVFRTYEALAAGAVDVLDKPGGRQQPDAWEQRFVSTVKLVSRIRVVTHVRGRLAPLATARPSAAPPPAMLPAAALPQGRSYALVALGASIGGPGAVLEILRDLPVTFPVPIVLVLHISRPFAPAFVEWLASHTGFRVICATGGEPIATAPGTVVIAPPDRHLVVRNGRYALTSDPERHSCRPSIDVLFESIARELGPSAVACLLTGMGRDGAAGLLRIRQAGGVTVAQDEATSVVYGMPREAVALGAASQIVPLAAIAPTLLTLATRLPERGRP